MLKKLIFFIVILLFSLNAFAQRTHTDEYYDYANNVLSSLRDGDVNQSTTLLKEMAQAFGEDEFIKVAYGINMLLGGQEQEALDIFDKILLNDPNNKYANYCLGFLYLKNKNIEKANLYFSKINEISDYKSLREYINIVNDTNYKLKPTDEQTFNSIVIDGYYLLRNGKYDKAKELFDLVSDVKGEEAFTEKPGILFSYDFKKPIIFNGDKYIESLGLSAKNKNKKSTVSGMVTVKADLSKIQNARMILFYIDDVFKGISNSDPSITFDSEYYSNGIHEIRIDALDSENDLVSSTNYTVDIFNQITASLYFDDKEIWKELWEFIQVRPSQAAVNYFTAVCDAKNNDRKSHRFDLEKVISCNPEYKDSKEILKKNYFYKKGRKEVISGPTNRKRVAITFDDGPTESTLELLDILDTYKAKATFFVVGKMALKHSDVLRTIKNRGHQVALHSYHHYNLTRLNYNELQKEVFQGYCAIKSCGVEPSLYLRPPGGNLNYNIKMLAQDYGINVIMWTKNTTHLQQSSPEIMADYCFKSLKPGFIYLLHNDIPVTTKALPLILSYFKSMNYECVTLEELFNEK